MGRESWRDERKFGSVLERGYGGSGGWAGGPRAGVGRAWPGQAGNPSLPKWSFPPRACGACRLPCAPDPKLVCRNTYQSREGAGKHAGPRASCTKGCNLPVRERQWVRGRPPPRPGPAGIGFQGSRMLVAKSELDCRAAPSPSDAPRTSRARALQKRGGGGGIRTNSDYAAGGGTWATTRFVTLPPPRRRRPKGPVGPKGTSSRCGPARTPVAYRRATRGTRGRRRRSQAHLEPCPLTRSFPNFDLIFSLLCLRPWLRAPPLPPPCQHRRCCGSRYGARAGGNLVAAMTPATTPAPTDRRLRALLFSFWVPRWR